MMESNREEQQAAKKLAVPVIPDTYPLESGKALVYHRQEWRRDSSNGHQIDLVEEHRRKEFRRSASETLVIKPASFEVEP